MTTLSRRLGFGLLVVALGGAFAGCGDDDGDDNPSVAGSGGSGAAGAGTGGGGGSSGGGAGGSGGSRAGSGGSGGRSGSGGAAGSSVECSNLDPLSAECVSCVQAAVTACGAECVALLNCVADKCGTAAGQAEQQACVSSCCLTEATTAVSLPNGQDTLRSASEAQRMACAAMCGGDEDAGS